MRRVWGEGWKGAEAEVEGGAAAWDAGSEKGEALGVVLADARPVGDGEEEGPGIKDLE